MQIQVALMRVTRNSETIGNIVLLKYL